MGCPQFLKQVEPVKSADHQCNGEKIYFPAKIKCRSEFEFGKNLLNG